MLSKIAQNVDQSMAYLARRRERSSMVPLIPDTAATPEGAIDPTGDANGEAADAGRQSARIVRLREQMNVLGLHAELDDAKVAARCGGEGTAHGREDAWRT